MPVVVTGASGFIGRRVVRAFVRTSPQVRAYVRRPSDAVELRDLGAKVALGDIEDVDTLQTVMSGAHTICHLVGTRNPSDPSRYQPEIAGSARAVLAAASGARVRRVLYLSYPGASTVAANPYLQAKGMAEEAIERSGIAYVIVRCAHVYGEGSPWLHAASRMARKWPGAVVGTGRQRLAPVLVDDVAAVLAAADDRARVASDTWGLEGPDRVTADEFALLLSGRRPKLHVPPWLATWLPRLGAPRETRALLDLLAADSVADRPDAAAEFGVALTPLGEGLRRSLPA